MPAIIGKPAPAFTAQAVMPDGSFKAVSLSDFAGKYAVVFFYPLDFTFVCPVRCCRVAEAGSCNHHVCAHAAPAPRQTEIIAFSDRVKEFKDLNAEVCCCARRASWRAPVAGVAHGPLSLVSTTQRPLRCCACSHTPPSWSGFRWIPTSATSRGPQPRATRAASAAAPSRWWLTSARPSRRTTEVRRCRLALLSLGAAF